MDVHREINNTGNKSPMEDAVNQSIDQLAQQLPIELTNTTATKLQHLNDDCLLELFSIKLLTPMDLCSLAETCTRFKPITQRVFSKKFTIEEDYNEYNVCVEPRKYLGKGKTAHDVERILKNFGSGLTAFPIDHRYNELFDVIDLVTKYCSGTLERLKIYSVRIPAVLAVKLKPTFQRLSILNIGSVTIEGGSDVFANCDSLIELRIYHVRHCNGILINTFPKLERFRFRYNYEHCNFDVVLLNFIARHQNLKTLNLDMLIDVKYKRLILQAIRDNCKELKELKLILTEVNKDDFSELQSLDLLQRLDIHIYSHLSTECILPLQALKSLETLIIRNASIDLTFFPVLAQLKNLRELCLYDFDGPENTNQLTLLTQLTKLSLCRVGAFNNLVDIIRQLKNLEELKIIDDWNFVLDKKMFSDIVEIVKGRPKVLKLTCVFDFLYNLSNCDKNKKVKLFKAKK